MSWCLLGAALGALPEHVVAEDEGGHGFDHRDGAGEDAGVVAAAALRVRCPRLSVVTVCWDCMMVAVGLKATRKTIGSPLLMPPWMPPERLVVVRTSAAVACERVVVFAAGQQGAGEARADLEALGGGQAQHGLGEVGLELVEDRFAEARRERPRTTHSTTPPTELPSARPP